MPKRNRAILSLVLPMAIFPWLIGWNLFMLGSKMEIKRKTAIPHPKWSHEKDVTFIMSTPEKKVTA
jgi:hypothetical protein